MSMKIDETRPIPADIAAWGTVHLLPGSPYRFVGDTLYAQLHAVDWTDLYHPEGKPALSPVLLALVTIFQHHERLSDRAAANAVRTRLDWKYALHLPLHDDGFDPSVLCEFRQRLIQHAAEARIFDRVVTGIQEQGLFRPRGRQRTDSTHVLAVVRSLNRLETVGETLRLALNTLAEVAPDWLLDRLQLEWAQRYGARFDEGRLPESQPKRQELALQIGQDGFAILHALDDPATPPVLHDLPAMTTLRQVWKQQYDRCDGHLHWRDPKSLPSATTAINSPHDPEARYSSKRSTIWVGYRVHLTESCDDHYPRIVTNVELTPAPIADTTMTATIHAHLADAERLPATHLVDAGYIDAEHLVASTDDYQIDLLGPVPIDPSWQSRNGTGFGAAAFQIDWATHVATCPQGQQSSMWRLEHDTNRNPTTHIEFAASICQSCPVRPDCTKSTKRGRQLNIRREAAHTALQAARLRQTTAAFKTQYAQRSGIEGTISYAVRMEGMRRSRYRGLAKTRLQELFLATALNVTRVSAWLAGKRPVVPKAPALVRLARMANTA